MKLAINLALSLVMLALCLWLVWPSSHAPPGQKSEMELIEQTFRALQWSEFWPYLAAYFGLMLVQHLCRSLRWNYLLAPLGIHVPAGPLLAISSVGFMAILALPLRLGELVRPGLLRRRGISASAALGTVAVERIIDGLMISMFVFVALFMRRGPDAPDWMMPTAFAALGIFSAALVFLLAAMKWPEKTVRFSLAISLLPRFAPKLAKVIEEKLHDMIRGFAVLRDVRNMIKFTLWTAVYWSANGLTVWVLAKGFQTIDVNFELSVTASFAVMGLVGVGISLPNAPGLVGQFQAFTLLGLSVYLGRAVLEGGGLYPVAIAYAILHHLFQVVWYVGMGAIGLASPWVSISDLRQARAKPVDETP